METQTFILTECAHAVNTLEFKTPILILLSLAIARPCLVPGQAQGRAFARPKARPGTPIVRLVPRTRAGLGSPFARPGRALAGGYF